MRWWSDCTSNWREKWSKVRNERNKVREECRQLRAKLEASLKSCTTLKREKHELESQIEVLRKQVQLCRSSSQAESAGAGGPDKDPSSGKDTLLLKDHEASVCSSGSHKSMGSDQDLQSVATHHTESLVGANTLDHKHGASTSSLQATSQEDFVSKLLSRKEKDRESSSSGHSEKSDKKKQRERSVYGEPASPGVKSVSGGAGAPASPGKKSSGGEGEPVSPGRASASLTPGAVPDVCSPEEEALLQQLTMMQIKLDESQKSIEIERE